MKKAINFNRFVTTSTRPGPDIQQSVYKKIIESYMRCLGWEKGRLSNLATSKKKKKKKSEFI